MELGLGLGQLGQRFAVGDDAAAGDEPGAEPIRRELGTAQRHRPRAIAGGIDPVRSRFDFVLRAVGALLITIGIVYHVDHLIRRIGLPAVSVAIAASLAWFFAYVPRVYNPHFDSGHGDAAHWGDVKWVSFGVAYLLAALAGVLVLVHKRQLERRRSG